MTLQEAYNLLFGNNGNRVTETTISAYVTLETLKKAYRAKQVQYHPDKHEKDADKEFYVAISKDIGWAQEIIAGYLKDSRYRNPHLGRSTSMHEYNKVKAKQAEKARASEKQVRDKMEEALKKAYYVYYYATARAAFKLTNDVYSNAKRNISFNEKVDLLFKYETFNKDFEKEIAIKKNIFDEIRSAINRGEITDMSTLEKRIQSYLGQHYDTYSDSRKQEALTRWVNQEYAIASKECEQKDSNIVLMEKRLVSRQRELLERAKNLYVFNSMTKIIELAKRTLEDINNEISEEEKLEKITYFEKMVEIFNNFIAICTKDYNKLVIKLNAHQKNDDYYEYLKEAKDIRTKIREIASEDYDAYVEDDSYNHGKIRDWFDFEYFQEINKYQQTKNNIIVKKNGLRELLIGQIISDGVLVNKHLERTNNSNPIIDYIKSVVTYVANNPGTNEELMEMYEKVHQYYYKYLGDKLSDRTNLFHNYEEYEKLLEEKKKKEALAKKYLKLIDKYYRYIICYFHSLQRQDVPDEFNTLYKDTMLYTNSDVIISNYNKFIDLGKKYHINLEKSPIVLSDEYVQKNREILISKVETSYSFYCVATNQRDSQIYLFDAIFDKYKDRYNLDLIDLNTLYYKLNKMLQDELTKPVTEKKTGRK